MTVQKTNNKDFVPHEQLLELVEIGFDSFYTIPTDSYTKIYGYYYTYNGKDWEFVDSHSFLALDEDMDIGRDFIIEAPLYQQVFRWFRDKGYDVKIEKESTGLYFGFYWSGVAWVIVGIGSYEESELACLSKLIEIVKKSS